jgi:hypothetical protein
VFCASGSGEPELRGAYAVRHSNGEPANTAGALK